MRIGFVTASNTPGNIVRGIDIYTQNLLLGFSENTTSSDLEIVEINNLNDLKTFSCDLYHFPNFYLFFPTIPWNLTTPYVVTVHDAIRLEYPDIYPPGIRGSLKLYYQKYILSRAKSVITDSYSSIDQIHKYLSVPHSKLKLVYLAHPPMYRKIENTKLLRDIAQKYALPPKFVLTNGEIDWNKNLAGLVKTCEQLNIPLVVYGKSSFNLIEGKIPVTNHRENCHWPELKEMLLKPNVKVLGYVSDEDLAVIFNLATIYCQPTFAEGFGLPVLQGLASGTPVACSRTHSIPEVAGESAVYFNPHDQAEMRVRIDELWHNAKLQTNLSASGLIQAKKFSWKLTAQNTLQVYREVLHIK